MKEPSLKHLDVLKKCFGHSEFRGMQWAVINSVLHEKKDTCVVMATGYGKSLCYQYPPVYLNKVGVVISPLISLMRDQVLALKLKNVPACHIGPSSDRNITELKQGALNGEYRLIYMSPEFAVGDHGKEFLRDLSKKNNVILVAIDEAHCVSQWGMDFRKSYRALASLRNIFNRVPFLAVTATATVQVRQDICTSLSLRNPFLVCTGFDRPNLYLSASVKSCKGPTQDIMNFFKRIKTSKKQYCGSTIIYCPTRKITEEIAKLLLEENVRCSVYHAGMSLANRDQAYNDFVMDINDIIVATVAFGMGIDKPDIRLVIHYGTPTDIESYYQEIGRAGRDGFPSLCHMFYKEADFNVARGLFSDLAGQFLDHKVSMLNVLRTYLYTSECRRQTLLSHFDQSFTPSNENPCCDNCDASKKSGKTNTIEPDISEEVGLFLKAVQTLKGRYGLGTYVKLLRGSTEKRLPSYVQQSSIFGAGKNQDEKWWKCLGQALLQKQLLKEFKPPTSFHQKNTPKFIGPTYCLSEAGEDYLNVASKKHSIQVTQTPEMIEIYRSGPPKRSSDGWIGSSSLIKKPLNYLINDSTSCPDITVNNEVEMENKVYHCLIEARLQWAKEMSCLPYMLLSSRALLELSKKRPRTVECLSEVSEMSEAIMKQLGSKIVSVICKVLEGDSSFSDPSASKVASLKKFIPKQTKAVLRYEESDFINEGDAASTSKKLSDSPKKDSPQEELPTPKEINFKGLIKSDRNAVSTPISDDVWGDDDSCFAEEKISDGLPPAVSQNTSGTIGSDVWGDDSDFKYMDSFNQNNTSKDAKGKVVTSTDDVWGDDSDLAFIGALSEEVSSKVDLNACETPQMSKSVPVKTDESVSNYLWGDDSGFMLVSSLEEASALKPSSKANGITSSVKEVKSAKDNVWGDEDDSFFNQIPDCTNETSAVKPSCPDNSFAQERLRVNDKNNAQFPKNMFKSCDVKRKRDLDSSDFKDILSKNALNKKNRKFL